MLAMTLHTSGCTPVSADRIVGADLARALPEFSAAPPDASIGYSPAAGARRVFHIDELRRIAAKYDVALASDREACFEWPFQSLSGDEVLSAMHDGLRMPDARIEIIEIATTAVPEGALVFPRSGLMTGRARIDGPIPWRGYILYGGKRRFDIWARVKISAQMTRVVSVTPIAAGHSIDATEVRLETVEEFPLWNEAARHLDEVIGHVSRRGIPAGHAVLRSELSAPLDVKAGDMVSVDVESGRAHLQLPARAETSGREGDVISVQNPSSGKVFRARVEGKGKVLVSAGQPVPAAN